MANPATLRPKPFKKGEDPRRHKKQKGETSWSTRIKIALSNVAKALKLGEDPDEVDIKILEVFIRETLKGKFPFMKEYLERQYGKVTEKREIDLKIEKLSELEEALKEWVKEEEGEKNRKVG